jgi:hypothetical protein
LVALFVPKINFAQTLLETIVKPSNFVETDIHHLNEPITNDAVSIYPNPFCTSYALAFIMPLMLIRQN